LTPCRRCVTLRNVTTFAPVRVAAVQATPVMLDLDASVEKAIELTREAAGQGAQLVVLPECFLSFYPSASITQSRYDQGMIDLFERMWLSAVDVPGPVVDQLARVCAELGVHLAIGVNERESARPGTLYNTLLLFGPSGLLHKHRKLMPTHHERLFHGIGAGTDLAVTDTPLGRIGGLICWEHRMPVARYAVYRGGPQIWVAPTMDDSDVWLALMRTIAYESGAWVISVCQYIHGEQYPEDFPSELPGGRDRVLSRGASVIVDGGSREVVAGPLIDEEGILIAECDLRAGLRSKQWFDSVGHYSREDVLLGVLGAGTDLTNGGGLVTTHVVSAETS
jgi:predicted amidohydrolase